MQLTPHRRHAVFAVLALLALPAPALGQQPSGEELLIAGGLALTATGDIQIEHQDVTIAVDRIRIVSVIRNSGDRDANPQVSFALPDLDTMWIWEQPPLLPRSGDANFVEAATTADGEAVTSRLEQRATALGIDVTDALQQHAIPIYPYTSGTLDNIAALSDETKIDLAERGILKVHERGPLPAWTLRTTIHWRQLIPAGKTVTLVHTYRPVVGHPTGSLSAFEKSACLDPAESKRIEARALGSNPAQLIAVAFQATAGAAWSDSIGKFRLTIEKPSRTTRIATCRTGLSIVSPQQVEWNASDHTHEDDLTILFVD